MQNMDHLRQQGSGTLLPEERSMQQKLEDKRWWNLHNEEKSHSRSRYWMTSRANCVQCAKHVFTWYGKLATQTSKKGRSVFSTSPTNIWSLVCMGLLTNTKSFYPTALFIRLKLQWKLLPLLTCTELFSEVQPLICSPTHRLPPAKKQTKKFCDN